MRSRLFFVLLLALTLSVGVSAAGDLSEMSIVQELYYENFSDHQVGRFPTGWVTREAEFGIPNFQVVEFAPSSSGKALRGFYGGVDHAHALMPGVDMASSDSLLLIEYTVWYDADATWATYLFDAQSDWPPYVDIRADLGLPAESGELQEYKVAKLFDLKNQSFSLYLNGEKVENNFSETKTYRNAPPTIKTDYRFGVYVRGTATSDVYWGDIRVSEVAR